MACPDEVDLSAYADGELTGDELAAVEAHVESCAACREEAAAMRRAALAARRALLGIAVGGRPGAALPGLRSRRRVFTIRIAAAAAAVAVIAIGGVWMTSSRHGERGNESPTATHSGNVNPAGTTDVDEFAWNLLLATADKGAGGRAYGDDAFGRWVARFVNCPQPMVPLETLREGARPRKVFELMLTNRTNGNS